MKYRQLQHVPSGEIMVGILLPLTSGFNASSDSPSCEEAARATGGRFNKIFSGLLDVAVTLQHNANDEKQFYKDLYRVEHWLPQTPFVTRECVY